MGKITIRETSQVGGCRSEVEYIFEDSSDYFPWSEQKTEVLNSAIKDLLGNFDEPVDTSSLADHLMPNKAKETKH